MKKLKKKRRLDVNGGERVLSVVDEYTHRPKKKKRRIESEEEAPPKKKLSAFAGAGEEIVQERKDKPKAKSSVVQPVEVSTRVRERKMTLWKLYKPAEEVKMHLIQIIGIGVEGNVIETSFIRTSKPVHLMRMQGEEHGNGES